MTKNEFLKDLRQRLSVLPSDEQDAAVSYYEEYFDEAGPEREEEILRQLGSAEKLTSEILKGQSFEGAKAFDNNEKTEKAGSIKTNRNGWLKVLLIMLLIIASPVILAAVGGILGGAVGILAGALAAVAAVAVVGAALGVGGISAFGWGVAHCFIVPLDGILFVGIGLILFAASVFILYLFGLIIGKVIPVLFRGMVSFVRRIFVPAAA